MDMEHFFEITEEFNKTFQSKLEETIDIFCDEPRFISDGRMMSLDFAGNTGYNTPRSNQVVVGLIQREKGIVEIQVQQGPLIIATATIDFQDFERDPMCGLTLQTHPLSMYNVYPLHVYENESDDFFQKCGYGTLSLYFSLLYSVSTDMTMAIICENPITAYILFVLFRSVSCIRSTDVQTNHPQYLRNLSHHEKHHGTFTNFADFNRLFSILVPKIGDLVYEVHATENNRDLVTRAIKKWITGKILCVSHEDFMAIYIKGPKLHDYHHHPRLQENYPQFSYRYVISHIDMDSD